MIEFRQKRRVAGRLLRGSRQTEELAAPMLVQAIDPDDNERQRLRTDALEKRADEIEGWARHVNQRVAFVETMVSEVDGFRMERARQIAEQSHLVERLLDLQAEFLERIARLEAKLEAHGAHIPPARDFTAHLERVRGSDAGTRLRPVLDLGAGRGDWLAALEAQGLAGRGIDLDEAAVAACRERRLACDPGDAIEALRRLPAGEFGLVSALHLLEHLRQDRLVPLFDEALRVLAPGGVLLVETTDPGQVEDARGPAPALAAIVARARGFADVETVTEGAHYTLVARKA